MTVGMTEKLIGGGDDVFDFRTVLGFEQWDRVDQDGGVGDQFGGLLESRQRGTGGNALFEDGLGFQLYAGG